MNQIKNCVKPHKCGENNLKTEFFMQIYTVQPPFTGGMLLFTFLKRTFLASKKLFLMIYCLYLSRLTFIDRYFTALPIF